MTLAIKLLFRIISPRLRRRFIAVESLALLSALVDTLAFGSLYPLLRVLTSYDSSKNWFPIKVAGNIFGVHARGQLELRLGLTSICIFILSSIVGLLLTVRQASFVATMEEDLATHIFQEYMEVPYLEHVSRSSSELVRNAHNIPIDISSNGTLSVLLITQNGLVIFFLVALIAIVSPVVVLGAIIYFGLAILLFIRVVSPRALKAGRAGVQSSGTCVRLIQEGFGGLKAFRSANATRTMSDAFRVKRHEFAQLRYRMILYSQLPQYYLQSVMIGGIILFVGILSLVHTNNVTSLIGIIVAAFIRLFPSLYQTLNCTSKVRSAQGSIEELYNELLAVANRNTVTDTSRKKRRSTAVRPMVPSEVERVEVPTDKPDWGNDIQFNNVTFTYPNSDAPALQNVTFDIARGSFVGIVGPSGAGKTTMVDMLLGLFLPDTGSVRIDDIDLTADQVSEWRRRVAYVPQEVFLLDATVRENIAFGEQMDAVDDERVWQVLQRAQLDKEVLSIDAGLDTRLGERGVRLSGGQRQRIGIARALYRGPEVLVLDEATSSLDVVTEAAVTKTVEGLGRELTRIVVAHRLSTVRSCDKLLLMRDGRVAGMGDFSSLRLDNDFFRDMADLARID